MASGGEMHKADYFKDGGKVFSEKELKEILDEALSHFYQGLNKLDTAMRYLEVKGQGGLRKPLSDKLKLDGLKESIEKIDEYISK
jgi:predicted aldo/keto reductase-like oxidoreductase